MATGLAHSPGERAAIAQLASESAAARHVHECRSQLSPHTPRSQLGEKVEVVQDVKGTASEGQEEQWCPATVASLPKSGSSLRVRLHGDDVASGCAPVSAPTPRHKPLFSSTPGPRGRAHAVVHARRPISARDWRWQSSSEHGSAALGVGEHVYVLVGPRGGREWREAQVRVRPTAAVFIDRTKTLTLGSPVNAWSALAR